MKKITLLKSLLVAVMLVVGASAWAAVGDVTTNANIDFSNPITNGVVAGTVNSMTIGSGEIAKNGDAGWLSVYDATSTVTIPEAQRAGSQDIVNIQFKMAWGNKNSMGSGFNLKDAEGNALASFQYARWDGNGQNANDLNIDMTGLVGGHNGNKPMAARYTLFDITVNYATRTITSKVFCNNTDGKGTTKEETFTVGMTTTSPIATFNVFGYNVGNNQDRASIIDDVLIKTTEGDYSVTTYDYTVNWVCGETIVKTWTGNGASGSAIELTSQNKEPFIVSGQRYFYVSDDSEGKVITASGTTVTITVREALNWTHTVNALDEDNNFLTELASTGETMEGDSKVLKWSKYIKVDEQWYVTDENTFQATVTEAGTKNVVYKTSNIAYFFEMENLTRSGGAYLTEESASYSNGSRLRLSKGSTYYTPALTGGVYLLNIGCMNSNSSSSDVYVRTRDGEGTLSDILYTHTAKSGSTTLSYVITVPDGCSIAFNGNEGTSNNNSRMDYMTLKKINSISIIGDFSENGWATESGIAMTQSTENTAIWTAVVDNFVVTSSKWSYDYKAVANGKYGDYELPSSGNQNYNFNYAEAGEGTYKLTFTVNTTENSVELAIEKLEFTFTVGYVDNDGWGNLHAYTYNSETLGGWPGTAMTEAGEVNGKKIYTISFDAYNAPANIIFNNGDNGAQTGNLDFVDNNLYGIAMPQVKVTDAGYATYCSPYALDFSNVSLTAYRAEVKSGAISFEEVTKVPAGEGVLVKGDEGTYDVQAIVNADAIENEFVGALESKEVATGSFVLLKGDKGVGFYKTKNAFTVGANTAYLPAISTARSFISLDGDSDVATGIESVKRQTVTNNEYYNLNGQRVAAPVKGLYIVNGKKIVVK